jgi:hypothetical protein
MMKQSNFSLLLPCTIVLVALMSVQSQVRLRQGMGRALGLIPAAEIEIESESEMLPQNMEDEVRAVKRIN